MENKELYSYIVQSLDILNRSLTIHEQNTVKLFSYLHNGQVNIINDLNYINENYTNKIDFNNINNSVNDLEKCVVKLNNTIKKIENKVNKLESKINDINSTTIITPIIVQEDNDNVSTSKGLFILIKKYYIHSIIYIKQLYNKVYRYIFKKKIQRELKEQERIYQEKLMEKRRQEEIERKEKIKEILNKRNKK